MPGRAVSVKDISITSIGSITVSYPGIRRREDATALRGINPGNRRAKEEKKCHECGEN
jgi:hypothetical protein